MKRSKRKPESIIGSHLDEENPLTFGHGPAGQQVINQQNIDNQSLVVTNTAGITGFDAHSIGTDTTLTLDRVNIRKLEIDAKDIIMDLDMGRAENILERLSMDGLKRFIGHCEEMKCLAEKMLLQYS
jgi:hypothetical protein